jgi:trk system potassium uptake protein TrkH
MLVITGALMLTGIPVSIYYEEGDFLSFLYSGLIALGIGLFLWKGIPGKEENTRNGLKKREGFLIVTLGWVSMSFIGTLPYIISGNIPSITDAFFETISGFSTTGASILDNIEATHKGILYWRSLTQWIGGMGIIVMTVAILPMLGIGGMELFIAEAPGPTSDKLHPRIKETAKRLWAIYVILTGVLLVLLMFGGMSFYDAINHALTTMATGGFSIKNESIAYYDSAYIQYIITLFMFIAGTNYTLLYFGFKGKFSRFWQHEEFKWYLFTCLGFTLTVFSAILYNTDSTIEKAFRDAIFQVISIITTTGFVSADFTQWSPFITMLFLIMMFLGGSAGSTSGGIKIVRHVTMAKNCFVEFKRLLHPRAIIPVKLNSKIVNPNIISHVLVFILIYLIIFVASSCVMSVVGLDFESAISSVATCLGNVGPGLGSVSPVDNFSHIPSSGKWFLSFLMIIGRLELFTVLIIFTPYFWKTN